MPGFTSHDFKDWPINDLRMVSAETFTLEDGSDKRLFYGVYSYQLDKMSYFEEDDVNLQRLYERGIQPIELRPISDLSTYVWASVDDNDPLANDTARPILSY